MLLLAAVGLFTPLVSLPYSPGCSLQQARSREQGMPPEGLSPSVWSSLRAAYEASRHAPVAVAGGHRARNPGQRWTLDFDGRGFTARPDAGDWCWGLELVRYGFDGRERTPSGPACAGVEGQRLEYEWDAALSEWYVNDARGLEHGYTLCERPEGEGLLAFTLALRGELVPSVQADGRGVSFSTAEGGAALTYADLKVLDADGRALPAGIELALDGLRILVDERDARYPLTIDPIAQQAYLKASNTGLGDTFGRSVSVSGDTVVVGAPTEDSSATGVNGDQSNNSALDSGAAYVFVRSGATWVQQAYLKASNTGSGDEFGWSVAISDDTAVVGAPLEDNLGGDAGAAYVFARAGNVWIQQGYLKASNVTSSAEFGGSVAISAGTVVVGAAKESASGSGAAYVFARSGISWGQQARLVASNAGSGDAFGQSVAISGDTVLVGAPMEGSSATGVDGDQADNSAGSAGAAYVFVRTGASWSQQAYLKASNTNALDQFGRGVSVHRDLAVVGAPWEASNATGVNGNQADNSRAASGAAYVFVRNGRNWSQQAYLKASNTGGLFGWSVAAQEGSLVVGAYWENSDATGVDGDQNNFNAGNSGAAFAFARTGTTWSQRAYLKASDTDASDYFGTSVALSGDTVVVGAPYEDSNSTVVNGNPADESAASSGAANVFTGFCPPASATARNAGSNPASFTCTAPVLGALWQGTVDLTTTGHSSAFVYVFAAQATIALPGGQVVLGSTRLARFGPVAGPLANFAFVVPNDTALCGLHLTAQALHFGGVQPFATSNAMDLVVGL